MLSVKFEQFGRPSEVLHLEEVDTPTPAADEVLVRMCARAINPSDLLMVQGLYGSLPKLPATPGLEGMGIIEALGSGVSGLKIGQRVVPIPAGPGSWQEFLTCKANQLVPLPDGVPDATAAQLFVNPLTAWIMMFEELSLKPGDWLLQTAAGSTLGRIVLQLAKLREIKTINVVRRRDQAAELTALGADEVIVTDEESLFDRVMALTKNQGISGAIDAVGGVVGSDVVRALARRGRCICYGLLSGQPLSVDVGNLIFRSATVRGFWLAEWFITSPLDQQQRVLGEMLGLMARGAVVPPVEAEYPLKDLHAAIAHAEKPGRQGKVLLVS